MSKPDHLRNRTVLSEIHETYDTDGLSFSTSQFRIISPAITEEQTHFLDFLAERIYSGLEANGTATIIDADGDLILPRKSGERKISSIEIRHKLETKVSDVGLQVWKGALLLSDVVLSLGARLSACTILELGCGAGLTGICAAMSAKQVILTDVGYDILENCEVNIFKNDHLDSLCVTTVHELDWVKPLPGKAKSQPPNSRYAWTEGDNEQLSDVRLILAADVIYDPDLTRAFLKCAQELMMLIQERGYSSTLLVAIEKRFNFAIGDASARAHAFDDFWSLIGTNSSREDIVLAGERLDAACIPQWLQYQRKDLEICMLQLRN